MKLRAQSGWTMGRVIGAVLLTVAASHEIAGRVRSHVRARVDWVADVLVHIEPAGSK